MAMFPPEGDFWRQTTMRVVGGRHALSQVDWARRTNWLTEDSKIAVELVEFPPTSHAIPALVIHVSNAPGYATIDLQ